MATQTNTARRTDAGYVRGNTVRKEDLNREMNKPYKPVDVRVAKNRARAKKLRLGYVLFLAGAVTMV